MLDPLRDTYDHAFVLLALATVYALDRDAQIRAEIDALLSYLDSQLRSPHGGFAGGIAGVDAAAAKSADASVRGDDRRLRRDP